MSARRLAPTAAREGREAMDVTRLSNGTRGGGMARSAWLVRTTRIAVLAALAACSGDGGITVRAATVEGIRFVTQPSGIALGQPFTVSVELTAASGERVTSATDVVTISLTGGGSLGGNTSAAAVAGLATFTNLTVSTPGNNLALQASAAGFTTSSVAFSIADPCAVLALTVPGNASGSLDSSSCVTAGQATATFQFNATGTGGSTFAVTSAFTPVIAVMTNPPTEHVTWTTSSPPDITASWLLPQGSYLFRLRSGAGTGSFTITTSTTIAEGCVPRTLLALASITYNGVLVGTDCTLTSDGSLFKLYAIFSTRACTITMRSNVLDSYLLIANVSNQIIAQDDDSGGGLDARVSLNACSEGGAPIQILANTFPGESGAYTLTIDVPGAPASVSLDEIVPLALPFTDVGGAEAGSNFGDLKFIRPDR